MGFPMASQKLIKHLLLTVLLKLAVLAGLWWCFVRPIQPQINPDAVAAHLSSSPLVLTPKKATP